MDALLLDLYDTVARTRWGQLSDRIAETLGIEKSALFRAYEHTRAPRAVGTFGSAAGDMAAVAEAAGADPTPQDLEQLLAMERAFSEWGVELYDDSLDVAREARRRGVRTAIISNCSHSTRPIVDRLGIADEFDEILLSFEVGACKPDPRIYREALRRLDVRPEAAVFVDDQPRYCDGATAVGIETYLIDRDGTLGSEADGHRVIGDLRSLLTVGA